LPMPAKGRSGSGSSWMSYKLDFLAEALKEWKRLDASVKDQFKKKLAERMVNPFVPAAKLSGSANRYKIKLRAAGYRLVYEVIESELVVVVIAVGKRENNLVYKKADSRRK
jgi:mRNA interferase RelE/StbE